MKVTAIVLSAGVGKRMNADKPKQYLLLKEKPIIYYTLKKFEESSVDDIILVTGESDIEYCKNEIIEKYNIQKVKKIVSGGKERYNSVMNGLKECENTDYVLIHDGARPFIEVSAIENIIQQVKKYKACVAGMPVKDTIKVVDENNCVVSTPKRSTLWQIQTPQAFKFDKIKEAYDYVFEKDELANVTDDAMVWEKYFKEEKVKLIEASYTNIKITTIEDMVIGEKYL